jgi:hypothetical protein
MIKLSTSEREKLIGAIVETTLARGIASYDMPMMFNRNDPSVNKEHRRRFPIIQAKKSTRYIFK